MRNQGSKSKAGASCHVRLFRQAPKCRSFLFRASLRASLPVTHRTKCGSRTSVSASLRVKRTGLLAAIAVLVALSGCSGGSPLSMTSGDAADPTAVTNDAGDASASTPVAGDASSSTPVATEAGEASSSTRDAGAPVEDAAADLSCDEDALALANRTMGNSCGGQCFCFGGTIACNNIACPPPPDLDAPSGDAEAASDAAPDFSITVLSSAPGDVPPVVIGANMSSGWFAARIAPLNGFNSPVVLTVAGLPSGVSATFDANPVSGEGTSNLMVSADLAAVPGEYTLSITGTSATGLSHSAVATLIVASATSCGCRPDSGSSACDAGCSGGTVCVRYQAVGGYPFPPNDAGGCPSGKVLAPEDPRGCWPAPTFACLPWPSDCGATPSCACAAAICAVNTGFNACAAGQGSDLSCVEYLP
jgi:hypothetical protein